MSARSDFSDMRQDILELTIRHLEALKAEGIRFVPVSPETMRGLAALGRPLGAVGEERAAPPPARENRLLKRKEPVASVLNRSDTLASRATMPTNLSPEAKTAAMAELRLRALSCQKCAHLAASRKSVVFGVGDINAALMFVGEAPGADEDLQGEPFVGKAGQLLTRVIQAMGLNRDTVYIANVLKCRPDTPGQLAGNRKPTTEEMRTCLPFLQEQIALIQPKAIVALGGTAMEGLFGHPVFITKARGRFQEFQGIPVMPTYHPSYLLRNAALAVKRELWEDMLQVMTNLEMPITEKQRGFFLKGSS